MLAFWKWTEVYLTDSLAEYERVRGRLVNAGIRVDSTVRAQHAHEGRGHMGGFVQRNIEYKLYVRKEDAERARSLI